MGAPMEREGKSMETHASLELSQTQRPTTEELQNDFAKLEFVNLDTF